MSDGCHKKFVKGIDGETVDVTEMLYPKKQRRTNKMSTVNAIVGNTYKIISNNVDNCFNGIIVESMSQLTHGSGVVQINLKVIGNKPTFNGEELEVFGVAKGGFVFKKLTKKRLNHYMKQFKEKVAAIYKEDEEWLDDNDDCYNYEDAFNHYHRKYEDLSAAVNEFFDGDKNATQ